jgi:hypothetical protein
MRASRVSAAILLLVSYHVYLFCRTRRDPLSTSLGVARRTRALWVRSIMKNNKDILAVQNLRNWTMASTFLASTAIIIGLAIFNLALTADKQGELSLLIGPLSIDHPALWTAKLVLLGIDFLIAFFNFTLAVRYYNHTGFMIDLPTEDPGDVSVDDVIKFLNPRLCMSIYVAANYLENIADIIETGIVADSYKRLEQNLEISAENEERIKEIYKELFLAAQLTMEALLEHDAQKAQQVIDAKAHYNGLIESTRSHLYVQMKSETREQLSLYKIETSILENYRRTHNLLRRICGLIIKGADNLPAESSVTT